MDENATPYNDTRDNPTGCCPRFNREGWDGQELHFRDKRFLRAHTMSVAHVPLNMNRVFSRVQRHLDAHQAVDPAQSITLSRDLSPWAAEHLTAIIADVPEEETVTLTGDYLTKVFEGPYSAVRGWMGEMQDLARSRGKEPGKIWFYYTTCPKCAKTYGRNPVVGLVEV